MRRASILAFNLAGVLVVLFVLYIVLRPHHFYPELIGRVADKGGEMLFEDFQPGKNLKLLTERGGLSVNLYDNSVGGCHYNQHWWVNADGLALNWQPEIVGNCPTSYSAGVVSGQIQARVDELMATLNKDHLRFSARKPGE